MLNGCDIKNEKNKYMRLKSQIKWNLFGLT